MKSVRLGCLDDENAVLDAVRIMHGYGEWGMRLANGSPFPFSEERARRSIRSALNQDGAWIGLIENGGVVEGAVCIELQHPFCSDHPFIAEQWLFVLPEYRTFGHSMALIEFTKSAARLSGLPLAIGILSSERTAAKSKLYERALGQKPIGSVFLYQPQTDLASIEGAS